jgi:WD40 repeat protein
MENRRKATTFISYSRKDKRFARKLKDALESMEVDAWVDWEDIPHGADWREEIRKSIQASDGFVFILSPDSLKSKVCAEELDIAVSLNKKIVPVLYREIETRRKIHPKLSATNWVFMRTRKENFNAVLPSLVQAVCTDLTWVQQHTRLLQNAVEWERNNRNSSFLLSGSKLEEAEHWLIESTAKEDREVIPLQAEYINASRRGAVTFQRRMTLVAAVIGLVFILMFFYALQQSNVARNNALLAEENAAIARTNESLAELQRAAAERNAEQAAANAQRAEERENEAQAQRSTAQANAFKERPGELFTSTLWALESMQRFPSEEAQEVLRHNLSRMPVPIARLKQDGRIWRIEFSADGQYFVSTSADNTACVWTMKGENKYCVQHDNDVTDAIITNDNSLLITAGLDGAVHLWNFEDGSSIQFIPLGSGVLDIDINRNNTHLVAGREDGQISVIELARQRETFVYDFASGPVSAVKFQPNGQWVSIGTKKGMTRIWRLFAGTPERGPQHNAEIFNLAISPDGKLMVSASADSTARISRAETGRQTHVLTHYDWVEDIAFSPDSTWFVTVSDDRFVRVFDAASGVEKLRMTHGSFVQKVAVSSDGNWIVSTGYDLAARIWDAQTGALVMEASLDDIGLALAFSPDGEVVVVGDESGNVTMWDISALNARVGYIQFTEFVNKAKFDPEGRWILVNTDDKNLWQIPADQWTTIRDGTLGIRVLSFDELTAQMKVSPDSRWVVLSEDHEIGDSLAILYNLETEMQYFLPHSSRVTGLAISPDSRFLATTNKDNSIVFIWDIETGEQVQNIPFEETAFTSAYSPKDPLLAIGLTGKTVLWNLAMNSESAVLAQSGEITSLNFSAEGNWLATTSENGGIAVWDMTADDFTRPKYQFRQEGKITSIDFHPARNWLATAGEDGYVHLWDLSTGQEVIRIPHGELVSGLAFSPDGGLLSTVSRKTVQFWDVNLLRPITNDKLLEAACARLFEDLSDTRWNLIFNQETYRDLCPILP